jgi:hypothetical protein
LRTFREDCATIPRLNREIKKYLKRKAPSRTATVKADDFAIGRWSWRSLNPYDFIFRPGGTLEIWQQHIGHESKDCGEATENNHQKNGSGLNPRHSSIRFSKGRTPIYELRLLFPADCVMHFIHRPRRASKARGRQASNGLSSSLSSCGLYGLQTLMKAWHHIPFWAGHFSRTAGA